MTATYPENNPPTLSIVIPIFDLRGCHWGALKSALGQNVPPHRCEIIAVLGKSRSPLYTPGEAEGALLRRCDRVIQTELSCEDNADEIGFYAAGWKECRGDYVFFIEGHTAVNPQSIQGILQAIEQHPECSLFWGQRRDISQSPLGHLVSRNNARVAQQIEKIGYFNFGGCCIIQRKLLERVGGVEARYGRFGEIVISKRLLAQSIPVRKLDFTLTNHFNDMTPAQLVSICMSSGTAKQAVYEDARKNPGKVFPPIRHRAYRWLRFPGLSTLAYPFLKYLGQLAFHGAIFLQAIRSKAAFRLYFLAMGCTDLAGYCLARGTWAKKIHFPQDLPAENVPAAKVA